MVGRGRATKVLHQLRKSPRLANINPNQNTCQSTPPSSPTPLCKRPRPSTSSQYGSSSSHRDKLVNPQDTELSESSQVAHFPTLKEDINATSMQLLFYTFSVFLINCSKRLFPTKLKLLGQKVGGTPKNGAR